MRTEPVVLVHGWGGSFAQTWQGPGWEALLQDAGRAVIGVDLLGHGQAPKPHDPADYADLTTRISDALPAAGPVDAVGFSLGAATLLELACREPERFGRIAVGGVGANLFRDDDDGTRRIIEAVEGRGDATDVRSQLFAQYAGQSGNDPLALAAVLRRESRRELTAERLAAITCPVLVCVGDKDFAGPGDPLVEVLPDARLVVLKGTDHFATPESFAFIDATLEFLEAVPALIAVARAVAILRSGGLVAFPTETVYGLGADATSPAALRRLFTVKGRPADHPVIVHIAHRTQLDGWAATVPSAARVLAEAFWPGPLTLLVPRAAHVLDTVTGGRPAVGLRVPAQPLALELLDAFGGGIAAPSANRFGRVSPTTADHVRADLGNDVDLVLDGGPTAVGLESTIVDTTADPPVVLRPGGLSLEDLRAVVPGLLDPGAAAGPARAPGMLASHYAPRCRVELAEEEAEAKVRVEALEEAGVRAGVLDFGADVDAYAHELYARLRDADQRGLAVLVAVLPPPDGLGVAVRDRLAKAAAARPVVEDVG